MWKFSQLSLMNFFFNHRFKIALGIGSGIFLTFPSLLLSQKIPESEYEARSILGAISRAQQAFFVEYNKFGSSSEEIGLPGLDKAQYYNFEVLGNQSTGLAVAIGKNNRQNKTRDYITGVSYNKDNRYFSVILCRSTIGPNYKISDPSKAILNYGVVTGNKELQCNTRYGVQRVDR